MKKLLILGSNPETARLVQKAMMLGVYVVVTDNLPNSPAKKIADEAFDIDGLDIDRLEVLVKEQKINGVLVGIADPLVKSYFQLCKRLDFPCYITEKASEVFSDKSKLKRECKKFGIECIPSYTEGEVLNDIGITYPIVVKPSDGRSGKGITVCYDKSQVLQAIRKAKSYSRNKEVLYERYMLCDDVFFYYTFYKGKYILSAMPDRYTTKEQTGYAPVVLGATYPSKYMDLYMNTLHDKMCNLFRYLGIRDGILLMQAFVENDKFYLYDPGFRFQGGAPHILIEKVNGLDQEEFMIRYALGEEFEEEKIKRNDPLFKGKFVGSQVILLKKGTIGKIDGFEVLKQIPEIYNVTQRLNIGDEVNIIGSEQQVFLRIHIVTDSRMRFKEIISEINEKVKVYDINGKLMNLEGLQIE